MIDDSSQKPGDDSELEETEQKSDADLQTERIKQLARVVCICKGIPLGRVLDGLPGCETVQDVNKKVGTGSGGCQGERCGPRIKILLKKFKEHQKK